MLNILLCSFIMSYANRFLSQFYNPTPIHYDTIIKREKLSNLHQQFNKTKLDINTHIPFKKLINESIEETNKHLEEANRYTNFLERYSNW